MIIMSWVTHDGKIHFVSSVFAQNLNIERMSVPWKLGSNITQYTSPIISI